MRLWRYFAAYYLAMAALTLTLLVVLVVAVTLIDNAADLTFHGHGMGPAFALAACSAVEFAYLIAPVACFLGALVAGNQLAQRGEFLAVQAAGLRPWRVWGPFISGALFIATLGACLGETAVPKAAALRARIAAEQQLRVDALSRFYERRNPWFRDGSWLLYLPEVASDGMTFARPQAYRLTDGLISESIDADALVYEDHSWWLIAAKQHSVAIADIQAIPRLWVPLRVSIDDLVESTGNPKEMPTPEVMRLVARRKNAGLDTAAYRVELHNRWAHPAVGVMLVVLGLPWFSHVERRRSLAVALGGGHVGRGDHTCDEPGISSAGPRAQNHSPLGGVGRPGGGPYRPALGDAIR